MRNVKIMKVKSMNKVTHKEIYQINNQYFTLTNNPQIEHPRKSSIRSFSVMVIFGHFRFGGANLPYSII